MPTTWNAADLSNVTLSGGNLVASSALTGGVRSVYSDTSGKFYFEYTVNSWGSSGSTGFGIGNASANFATVGGAPVNAGLVYKASGNVYINNVVMGTINPSSLTDGGVICIAIDLAAKLAWFRDGAAGLWDFNAAHNPATGAGGWSISPIASTAIFALLGFAGGGTPQVTANFGATAFVGVVPSGFAAGWPAAAAASAQARAMVLA